MFNKRDQLGLIEAYTLMSEQCGVGLEKPVMITMDMPGAVPQTGEEGETVSGPDPSEIEMAAAELHKITEYAPKLAEMVKSMPGLEGWIAAKITKAADYISSVYHWLEYKGGNTSSEGMYNLGHEDVHCSYAKQGCTCGQCSECH